MSNDEQTDPFTAAIVAAMGPDATAQDIEASTGAFRSVLGTPAEQVGQFFRHWVGIKARNALEVSRLANEKKERFGYGDGEVPQRVALRIFDEAAYCGDSDHIVRDYLSGILAAASASSNDQADLANSFASLVSRMSNRHLRLHYYIYRCVHLAYREREVDFYHQDAVQQHACFIPMENMLRFDPSGTWVSSLFWLGRDGLTDKFQSGPASSLNVLYEVAEDGVLVIPKALGIELLIWGLGLVCNVDEFLSLDPEALDVPQLQLNLSGIRSVSRR